VTAADLSDQDLVLEIGPGLGSLTQALAQKAKRVVAIEKDPRLIPLLMDNLKGFDNIEIIQGDALKIFNFQLPILNQFSITNSQKYRVVANLPYYAATHIIRQFLEAENPPELMVLLLQKEVAQRISARPPKMSLLAVSVQLYADVKIIGSVSKKSFWPKPKVDGAIIKLKTQSVKRKVNEKLFFEIVRAGFSQPRKQLLNNLSQGLNLSREKVVIWLEQSKISPQRRPADLSLSNWLALTASRGVDLFS
jgi:16S rRNA (adenine1518-N6/adenine1519-N6)-dimethyltransferase